MVWNDAKLVMVLAYGPGRYDRVYEEGNVDYPIGYARWTENRNQQHFLRLLAEGRVEVGSLAPIRVPFDRAPEAYDILAAPRPAADGRLRLRPRRGVAPAKAQRTRVGAVEPAGVRRETLAERRPHRPHASGRSVSA